MRGIVRAVSLFTRFLSLDKEENVCTQEIPASARMKTIENHPLSVMRVKPGIPCAHD